MMTTTSSEDIQALNDLDTSARGPNVQQHQPTIGDGNELMLILRKLQLRADRIQLDRCRSQLRQPSRVNPRVWVVAQFLVNYHRRLECPHRHSLPAGNCNSSPQWRRRNQSALGGVGLLVSAQLGHDGPVLKASAAVEVHNVVASENLGVRLGLQETCHRPVLDPVGSDAHGQVLPVAGPRHVAVTAISVRCEEGNAYRELEHQRG